MTDQYKIGDTISFSGHEHVLAWDEQSQNLIDVHFGMDEGVGIILSIKEEASYGGEAEIYCDGQILILPWRPGHKPELKVISGFEIC